MNAREFIGQTAILQPPPGFNTDDPNRSTCGVLPVRIVELSVGYSFVSIWKPTADELARLNAGESVRLVVVGPAHPPVSLDVFDAAVLP